MRIIYVIFLLVLLVIVGQYNKSVGLALAGLILLGSILVNKSNFEKIMNGGAL